MQPWFSFVALHKNTMKQISKICDGFVAGAASEIDPFQQLYTGNKNERVSIATWNAYAPNFELPALRFARNIENILIASSYRCIKYPFCLCECLLTFSLASNVHCLIFRFVCSLVLYRLLHIHTHNCSL